MKKLVEIQEVDGEGLLGLLGQVVTLYCLNYIYSGKLVGVNKTFVKLEGAKIVYDTGAFSSKDWTTAESFPAPSGVWYVKNACIESYGILKG